MEQKPNSGVRITGWITVIFLLIGHFFKTQAWPGASVAILLASFIFLCFYIPFWFIQVWQEKEERPLKLIQLLTLFLFGATTLFKTMHWPGSGFFFWSLYYYSILFLVPYCFYLLFKRGKSSVYKFHSVIVLVLIITSSMSSIFRSVPSSVVTAVASNTSQIEKSIKRTQSKTLGLYEAFEKTENRKDNIYYNNAIKLKQLSDSASLYVHHLRSYLISKLESISAAEADSFSIMELRNKTNLDIPEQVLIGDPMKLSREHYSGLQLKKVIDAYRDSSLKLIESENREFIESGINLGTASVKDENGEPMNWVNATFLNLPSVTVLSTLSSIEFEIKNTETQILSDLLNSASRSSGNNLALKIAELGDRLESEKKEKQISILQKESQLDQLRLDTKNSELEQREKTIVWFIVAMMFCSVMIFYIIRSNMIRRKINLELKAQKQLIETKNKEITDSINYARRIQSAILPPVELICSTLQDAFVLYKPKDVVSGDFYGFFRRDDYVLIAIADCTGHGVPGAFMSMIGNEQLNKIITEKGIATPSDVLNELHSGVRKALKQDRAEGETRDGMDIALCKYYLKTRKLEYAGAMRPLWLLRNGALTEIKADKQPIGGLDSDYRKPFTNHVVDLNENDCIYMFTDGYADQFGGEKGKKFMLKNFERLLTEIADLPMQQQQQLINEKFEAWKGSHEQVDDVLVAGIRV